MIGRYLVAYARFEEMGRNGLTEESSFPACEAECSPIPRLILTYQGNSAQPTAKGMTILHEDADVDNEAPSQYNYCYI